MSVSFALLVVFGLLLSLSLPFLFSFSFFFSFFVLTVIAFTRPVQLSRCKKSTCLLTLDWTFKTNYLRILGRVLKQFSVIFWLLKQEHNLVRTTLHPFRNTKKAHPTLTTHRPTLKKTFQFIQLVFDPRSTHCQTQTITRP